MPRPLLPAGPTAARPPTSLPVPPRSSQPACWEDGHDEASAHPVSETVAPLRHSGDARGAQPASHRRAVDLPGLPDAPAPGRGRAAGAEAAGPARAARGAPPRPDTLGARPP